MNEVFVRYSYQNTLEYKMNIIVCPKSFLERRAKKKKKRRKDDIINIYIRAKTTKISPPAAAYDAET